MTQDSETRIKHVLRYCSTARLVKLVSAKSHITARTAFSRAHTCPEAADVTQLSLLNNVFLDNENYKFLLIILCRIEHMAENIYIAITLEISKIILKKIRIVAESLPYNQEVWV